MDKYLSTFGFKKVVLFAYKEYYREIKVFKQLDYFYIYQAQRKALADNTYADFRYAVYAHANTWVQPFMVIDVTLTINRQQHVTSQYNYIWNMT